MRKKTLIALFAIAHSLACRSVSTYVVDAPFESPLPPKIDADRDGLVDAEEDALARLYAPLVYLDRDEPNLPASTQWIRARVRLPFDPDPVDGRKAYIATRLRAGSRDPRDWVTYAHVYSRKDGGIDMQYWFYFPYNTGAFFFDHDSDWEHVSIILDNTRTPVGAAYARHRDNAPGPFRPWNALTRLGTHPIVLSARGSHASYTDSNDVPFFDHVSGAGPRWRTWENVVNVGEIWAPRKGSEFIALRGQWGGNGSFWPGTDAPEGPAWQRGWCPDGFRGCGPAPVQQAARSKRDTDVRTE